MLSTSQRNWTVSVVVGVCLLMGFYVTAVAVAPYVPVSRDFDQTFYPAAKYVLAGEDPYTGEYIENGQGAPPDFFSPPWVLLLLTPFGFFDLEIARALWVLFLTSMVFVSIVLLRQWGLKSPWLFLLTVFPWTLISILYGQVTAVVLLGAVLGVPEIYKPLRTYKSALILLLGFLLLGVKPQLGLLIALPMVLQLLWQRDRRLIIIMIGGSAVLVLTMLATPTPFWLIAKSADVQNIAPQWTSTLERELAWLNWPLWIGMVVRLIALVVTGIWIWRARRLSPTWWAAWFAFVLIVTPYSRAYDGVLLLPLLGYLLLWNKYRLLTFVVGLGLYFWLAGGELGTVLAPLWAWLLFVPWLQLAHGGLDKHPYADAWDFEQVHSVSSL